MQVCLYVDTAVYLAFCPSLCFSLVVSELCVWMRSCWEVRAWKGRRDPEFTAFFHFFVSLLRELIFFLFFFCLLLSLQRPGCSVHYRKCSTVINVLQFLPRLRGKHCVLKLLWPGWNIYLFAYLFFFLDWFSAPLSFYSSRCCHITSPTAQETLSVGCTDTVPMPRSVYSHRVTLKPQCLLNRLLLLKCCFLLASCRGRAS